MAGKIYVVDGSRKIPAELANQLGRGYEVKSSRHPDLALLEILSWRPDLLVTGVEVGNITGPDLCTILKMIPDLSSIPVILLSAAEDERAINRIAAEVGVDYYIKKDRHAFTELTATIRAVFHDASPGVNRPARKTEKVLLVDDSLLVRTMLANMLRSSGVPEILQAEDGEEAWHILSENEVDFILSDYYMPVLDGPGLVRKIKEERQQDVPVIIATGVQEEDRLAEILAAGANGVLVKPISSSKLKKVLQAFADGTLASFGRG